MARFLISTRRLAGTLLRLRLRLSLRRVSGASAVGAALVLLVGTGAGAALGWATHVLFLQVPRGPAPAVMAPFLLALLCFLIGLFWLLWPLVAAQIDEAQELGRYLHYPVRSSQLHLVHALIGLVEPATLLFYPPLVGAILALSRTTGLPPHLAALPVLCFAVMHVSWGRALQHLMLNVVTSRRSAEALAVLFLLFLGATFFLPPVDASWLFGRLDDFGSQPRDLALLRQATRTLAAVPPGWLARALLAAQHGQPLLLLGWCAAMLATGSVGWWVGLRLLDLYYRGSRRVAPRRPGAAPRRARGSGSPWLAELRLLARNPKARLLFVVPLFLVVLLRVVGASQLLAHLWGGRWAALLLTLLVVYALMVLATQLFANGFGYDGHAIRQRFASPAPVRRWLLARTAAQAVFALAQLLGIGLLVLLGLDGARTAGLLLPLCTCGLALPVLLGLGNLLSARFPRRFDPRLTRRDRPVGISLLWVALVVGLCGAASLALWRLSPTALLLLPPLGLAALWLSLPLAERWTREQREALVHEIAR